MLWDSVQFVNNSWTSEEEGSHTPHVIAIVGWGQPGSDDAGNDSERRKMWKAWCAVHRLKIPGRPDQLPLLILEFELEDDDVNPLYPPESESPLPGSPDSGSTVSGATTTRTSLDSHAPSLCTDSGMTARSARSADGILPGVRGLNGDHEWQPSPEDVLESTTSRSKPLKTLQRIRKLKASHDHGSVIDGHGNPNRVRRKGKVKRNDSANSVGVMDAFAVMSQVNEQFGNAPDLETFLNVIVGVVKELTQFHRVFVYQFDEVWNRFVVAELVDWSKTRGLFKGLHFPESDIPPQACVLNRILVFLSDWSRISGP